LSILADGTAATWGIVALATGGIIIRPRRVPEALWAVLGAVVLVVYGLLPWTDALAGVRKGLDVYLFLIGMMVLAELARREGLFDWLAAFAVAHARGSPQRLFTLVYGVGTIVTVFLSNDATAVVLTPAVYAAARAAGATPLPYLSSAPSSPTRRASCCRSRTRQISCSSMAVCPTWPHGWHSSPCRRLRQSARPI
jgi:arsenical pump membrane protein